MNTHLTALSLAIAVVSASTAHASASDPIATLPAITVTAPTLAQDQQRYQPTLQNTSGFTAQRLQDTPATVASFERGLMDAQQAKTLADVTKNDPSINVANTPLWYDRVNVRGFDLGTTATQRNGLSINDQGSIALENKQSIEVSKGLTGLKNGVTSPGGVINYITKRPTSKPLKQINISTDGFGSLGVHGDFSGFVGTDESLGIRVNVAKERLNTYIDPVTGERDFFSTAIDWHITSKLKLEMDYEYHEKTQVSASQPSIFSFDSVEIAQQNYQKLLKPETFLSQAWSIEPNRQNYLSGKLSYQMTPEWSVDVLAQQAKLWRTQNAVSAESIQPNGDYNAFLYYAPDQERNNSAFRLQLNGEYTTGHVQHVLAAGLDSLKRDMTYPDGYYEQIGTGNVLRSTVIANPRATSDASYLANRTEQTGAFINNIATFNDRFDLHTGVRYTKLIQQEGSGTTALTETYDRSAVTPSLALVYRPTENTSLYASYAEGIEQGGIAPDEATNRNDVLPPLSSDQYELGLKHQLNGALLNFSIYKINKGLEYINTERLYVQDGRQIHQGIEATVAGQLLPHMNVMAGVGYIDATIEDSGDPLKNGLKPTNVPKFQANFFASYDVDQWVAGAAVDLGVYHQGKFAMDENNTWMTSAATRIDLGAQYKTRLAGYETVYRVALENLADEQYLATSGNYAAPRTVKLTAQFEF